MFKTSAVLGSSPVASAKPEPAPKDACFQKGEEYYNIGDYIMAVVMYKAALAFDPSDKMCQVSKELAEVKSLSSVDPYQVACLSKNKGDILYNLEKYQEALKYYDEAVTLAPGHSRFHNCRGNTLYSLKNYQEADACYSIAITLDPENPVLYRSKGFALAKLSDHRRDAIDVLDKGATLYGVIDSAGSIECYDKIIEIHQQNAYAYCNKGNILYTAGKLVDALKCYDAVISISALGYVKSLRSCTAQSADRTEQKYHYIDAYIGKSKILDILGDQRELGKTSTKFIKILSRVYESKLYKDLQDVCEDNRAVNIILGYATGTEKEFMPLSPNQEQITLDTIEIALTGVIDS